MPTLPAGHPLIDGRTSRSDLVRAARCEPVDRTPVWFMRQAGRSLPEYRAIRAGKDMLDSCFDRDLVVEATMQPVRRHGVDAAVLFSDIVAPLRAAGVDLTITQGVGPVVACPFRGVGDLRRLSALDPQALSPIIDAISDITAELGGIPLIGFAGAPFTLASYLIEGGPSRTHAATKALMHTEPATWHRLMKQLSEISAEFLRMQVEAGASVIQLFDSWVGALSPRDYGVFAAPHSARVLGAIAGTGVPRIHFGVGTGELLPQMAAAGAEVIGVDFRLTLGEAARRLGGGFALQGNLDPALLLAGPEAMERAVAQVLDDARGLPGHIFNLGHGMLPETDPAIPGVVVDIVHAAGRPTLRRVDPAMTAPSPCR